MESAQSQPATPVVAVVDDDPTVTLMLDRILTRAGYTVRVFDSGEGLLERIGEGGIDLICLDLSLPGIDGLETLARLKAMQVTLPVILFTASAEEVTPRALAGGAFACVPKAGAWTELRTAVAAGLAATRRPQEG